MNAGVFRSRVAEDGFLLGHDAASWGNRIPTFRRNVQGPLGVIGSRHFERVYCLYLQEPRGPYTFLRNVGIRLHPEGLIRSFEMSGSDYPQRALYVPSKCRDPITPRGPCTFLRNVGIRLPPEGLIRSFEMSGSDYPVTHLCIPEERNRQLNVLKNVLF
jgi:hypothetical protein